jgi:hypothetical protein
MLCYAKCLSMDALARSKILVSSAISPELFRHFGCPNLELIAFGNRSIIGNQTDGRIV